MSISSSDANNRSENSNQLSLSLNPNSHHGSLHRPFIPGAISGTSPATSPHLSPPESLSVHFSGCGSAASADSRGSYKKVTDVRNGETKKGAENQNRGNTFDRHSSGRGGLNSEFRSDQYNYGQFNGKLSGAGSSSQVEQSTTGFKNTEGGNTHSATRRNQTINANHLLNFHYDPISRPLPKMRMPPPRKPHKLKPYNKDLFLQANFKFVVLDSGNPAIESVDPDKMLQWEGVICVRYSTPFPVQCPICLETPLCPQITSCGHIFCFPCILRYLLMSKEDHKGDFWKKCPLCFMMISVRDLYTVNIERVKQYHVNDHVDFVLLNRLKGSLVPSQKSHQESGVLPCSNDCLRDSFSKFTLTSDVEMSVRDAKMELSEWLARAESGFVEDMEQLPYVCAALEHLDQRQKSWTEQQGFSGSPPTRSSNSRSSSLRNCEHTSGKSESFPSITSVAPAQICEPTRRISFAVDKDEANGSDHLSSEKQQGDECDPLSDASEALDDGQGKISCSYEEDKGFQRHPKGFKDVKEKESYTFYQANDGQHLILHPLNMKCLLHHYGSYDLLPPRIGGKILQMETVTQSEAMRRRYRFLSHFSLTTTFQLCEIDLSDTLPPEALSPFLDEIKRREKQRKKIARKENEEKARAEAAAAVLNPNAVPSDFRHHSYKDLTFSIDDFEALGNSLVTSTSPLVVGDRMRFSDVTRMGFAAAYDSPSLKAEEPTDASTSAEARASSLIGRRTAPVLSFANIISTEKSEGGIDATLKMNNGFGKKGKKPSKVLLSTAGGRRY